MTRTFIYTEPFRKCWKAMGLSDRELPLLEETLLKNPQIGDVILHILKMCRRILTADQKKAISKMIELIRKE